jgi:hypothetical protein
LRLATDSRPGFCSACFNSDTTARYVDFEAAYDGAPILDRERQTIAVLPWSGELGGHDDLFLCERCVRQAMELLAFSPEREGELRREVRRLEIENEHWRANTRRLEGYLRERPEPAPRAPRRKVAA